eukprot:GFUD01019581.1.p1 GENE.GFUD01019581.1~~GFUD01019581.1.p1  ORF type:complete len:420 (-),score=125.05 GFUD01019581.1:259-1518(-)
MKLLVKGIGQLVTVSEGTRFLAGKDMSNIKVRDGCLAVAVDNEGKIAMVGSQKEVTEMYNEKTFSNIIDAGGQAVIPGFVDGHTHPVWAGDRVHEFAMKLAGASYMEVHAAGGGIHFTVDRTREASEQELLDLLVPRLQRMLRAGTTTVECKSGYGLDAVNEVKMLRVLERAKKLVPIEISSTFCGGHAVPKGSNAEAATKDVIENQLAAVLKEAAAGNLNVENIDVFCEKGVFEIEDSRKMLKAGKAAGLRINFHGDELHPLGGAEMGAELKAEAISHLEEISPAGMQGMADAGSVAVILPTTAYILRLKHPPVRDMINCGVIVALGTDFNPNAYCLSMTTVMHLACVNLKMSLSEAMAAATINAAHSLGRSATHGSIEEGKVADLIVLNEKKWEHVVYQFGQQDVIKHVVKNGNIVV